MGILRDITERKKIEEVQQLTQFSTDHAADSVFWVGPDAKILYVNDAACRFHGYSRRELLSMTVHDIDPNFPEEAWPEHWKEIKQRSFFTFESHHRTKNGRVFPVEISVNFLKFRGKEYNCAFVRDISGRKQDEEALKESEKKYRMLIEQSLQAIIIIQDYRIVFANEAFAKITGYTVKELFALPPKKVRALVHSKGQPLVWGRFKDRLGGKSIIQRYEYRGIRKDGSLCWLEMYAKRINYNGKPAVQGAIIDITERKLAEQSLIIQNKYNELRAEIWKKASDPSLTEETELVQALLDTVGPSMDVSRTAYLRFIPKRKAYVTELQWYKKELGSSLGEDISLDMAKHFFGRDSIEIPKDIDKIIRIPGIKRTVKLYVSSKLRKHYIKSYLVIPYGDINNPDGLFTFAECEKEREWSELEKKILSEVVNIVSLKVEQMNADKKIKASLREKEVLLQEVHHRVKNNMQIISSLLNLQSKNVKEERILETFKSTQNRVRSMALIHEKIYRSKDFARIDFAEYVQSLTSHLYHSFGISDEAIKLKTNIKNVLLDINTAIPCGLIINELISNSFKHAFPDGKKGEIHISMHPLNENKIELTISDNGVGVPEDVDYRNTESLGLHLVTILAEGQLHGAIRLDRKQGTKFQIRMKI
jgi:PAS domain S-box-containing protein